MLRLADRAAMHYGSISMMNERSSLHMVNAAAEDAPFCLKNFRRMSQFDVVEQTTGCIENVGLRVGNSFGKLAQ